MFCPKCATENQSEQKYCRRCGQPLAGVHLALEGRVDEAIKTLKIGEKKPRVIFVLLAIALLALLPWTANELRNGAPLTFLLMPAWGLLLGLLIGLSKRAFKLWQVKRLLNARVEFKSLTANAVASPDFAIAGNSSEARPPVPVSVTENTTLELRSSQKVQK
jgi:hypothetical protein